MIWEKTFRLQGASELGWQRGFRLAGTVVLVTGGLWFTLSQRPAQLWVYTLPLLGLVWAGVTLFVWSHPLARYHTLGYRLGFWVLPAALVVAALLFLRVVLVGDGLTQGVALTGLLLALVLSSQYQVMDPTAPGFPLARSALYLVLYLVAFALFAATFDAGLRGLPRAGAIGGVSALLAWEAFRENHAHPRRNTLYALAVGTILAQITVGLDYWPAGGLLGGIFLLLLFYAFTGIAKNHFAGSLSRGTVLEFGAVTTLGLLLLFGSRLWSG